MGFLLYTLFRFSQRDTCPQTSIKLSLTPFFQYLPSIRSRSRSLHRNSLRKMKLQTTAANKEDEYDLGEDEDQPESEDNDSKFHPTY